MKRTDITALFPDATDEQIQKIMDLNGSDINKAKDGMEALRGQLTAAQAAIDELKAKPSGDAEKAAALQKELDELKAANTLRDLRARISKETGVPASLLTETTEEACKTQAEAIKSFAGGSGYPRLPDGGESRVPSSTATRDKFASWFQEAMPNN
ncbi:MAG: hypothetical protein IKF98_01660 [Clostridia bacterium]|nr:hypothetical protein [Clostridia bacterium]